MTKPRIRVTLPHLDFPCLYLEQYLRQNRRILQVNPANTRVRLFFKVGVYPDVSSEHVMEPDSAEDHVVVEYDIPEDEPVSIATVRAISALKECGPCDLTPLYGAIDPDMLDDLCESQQEGTVKFVFSDFHLTLENGDCLLLRPVG